MLPFNHILNTKLNPPRVGVNLLERPHLWDKLKQYPSKKLTLISAPAGYGKTVLISQFTGQISSPVVWYHLDHFDNDVTQFIHHLLAGLNRFLPGIGEEMLSLIEYNNALNQETRHIIAPLINSISDRLESELVLAIDDYHIIEENLVHSFLESLLKYLPESMHIFLSSRTVPPLKLERLKVSGLMIEITWNDLRFTREEIAKFLEHENNQPVSRETVAALDKNTQGWPAALRLAGMAISRNNKNYIQNLNNTNFPHQQEFFHYLAAEVLDNLPEELSSFVLSTCVMDVMTPEACDLFLERNDTTRILEDLSSRNLFITAMEGKNQIYRYHPLFKEFLQNQLKEEQKRNLYWKCGKAYLQCGFLSQAVESFLNAADYEQAVATIEKAGGELLLDNHWQTIERWLSIIPEKIKENRPWILLQQGAIFFHLGQLDQAETLMNEATSMMSEASDQEGQYQATLYQARIMRSRGRFEKSIELLKQILPHLSLLPVAEWYDAALEHSFVLLMKGDFTSAYRLLKPAQARAEHEEEWRIASWLSERMGMLYYFQGKYSKAIEVHQRAAEIAPQYDRLSFSLWDSLTAIYHDWGDLEQALDYAQSSIQVKERLLLTEVLPYAYSQLAFVQGSMDNPAEAENNFLYAIELAQSREGEKFFQALIMAFYNRFLTEQGRIEDAISTGNEALEISRNLSEFIYALCLEMAAPAHIQQGNLQKAVEMLEYSREVLENAGAGYFLFYSEAYLAFIYRQQNHPEADRVAEKCLKLAGAENYFQFFLSHREMMLPVVKMGLLKGIELDFIYETIKKWGRASEELLLELLRHEDSGVRQRALFAISHLEEQNIAQTLEGLLSDPCEEVRNQAMTILSKLQTSSTSGTTEKDTTDPYFLLNQEASLKVQCLGPFRVFINGEEVTWRTNKARDLFAYLFHYREKPVHKDKILEDIWPDSIPERASTLLHTNLYQLRKAIKNLPGSQPVNHKGKQYHLEQNIISSDIDIFLKLTSHTDSGSEVSPEEVPYLEQALSLYQGEYMENLDYQWITEERERLNQIYLSLLEKLSYYYMKNDKLDQAATCLRSILHLNPLLEEMHVLLMKVYSRQGDRMAVMQQYQTLCKILDREMGLEPSPETRALYYRLCSE